MGAERSIDVTGANKNSGPATAGGTFTHWRQRATGSGAWRNNPTRLATPQTIGAGGMLNIADAGIKHRLGRITIFTVNAGTDVCTMVGHGLSDTNTVTLASTGTLPAGLAADTQYFIRDATADTFKLAATSGGTAIDITDTGTGVHTVLIEGQHTNATLIAALDSMTLADTDEIFFGTDGKMSNSTDIAAYVVDNFDAAVAF